MCALYFALRLNCQISFCNDVGMSDKYEVKLITGQILFPMKRLHIAQMLKLNSAQVLEIMPGL